MILGFNSGPIGIQPHGVKALCVNKHGSALAIGDVVITSFAHTNAIYPPADTVTSLRLSPFSCVKKADGDLAATGENGAHAQAGYVGVVTGLGQSAGADNTDVEVQFGGIANALCAAVTNNIVLGSKLYLSDTAGRFGNAADSTAPDTTVAVSLGSVTAAATGIIPVLLFNGPIDVTTQ